MNLTCHTGESKVFRIPLRLDNADLTPGDAYILTFTLKADKDDEDSAALVQKRTGGYGITVSTHFARVALTHVDTAGGTVDEVVVPPIPEGTYYWDIQSQLIASPYTVRQVNRGTFVLEQAITRELETSIPIYTTDPPVSSGSGVEVLTVADETARLALSYGDASGVIVKQEDDDTSWVLLTGGDPSDTADWVSVGGGVAAALMVADQAARLALSAEDATGRIVVQEDDSTAWLLSEGGDPAVEGDWLQIATGSSTYAGLDDAASVDLPTVNTPLATALSGKLSVSTAASTYQPLAAILTATTASFTTAQETKLSGIASGATANSSDAALLARANHTGTQSYTTITGLGTLATQNGTFSGTSSNTNTGDQTSIVGITGTKAQFQTAMTDDDFLTLAGTQTVTGAKTFTGVSVTNGTETVPPRIISGVGAGITADNAVLTGNSGYIVLSQNSTGLADQLAIGTISGATTVATGTTWTYADATAKTAHLTALGTSAYSPSAVAITGGTIAGLTGFAIRSTGAAFDLAMATSEVLTAGRTLSWNVGNAARTITLSGNPTLGDWFDQSVKTGATPSFTRVNAATYGDTGGVAFTSGFGILRLTSGGTNRLYFGSSDDTTIEKGAAGRIDITGGSAGAYRDLMLRTLTASGTLAVTGTATLTGGIVGKTDASNATAGNVGELVSSAVASGSAVSLTTTTAANVTSISLTAGDWDVEGNVNLAGSTATYTGASGGVGTTTATVPTDGTEVYSGVQFTLLTATDGLTLPRKRINVSSTTTVYLVCRASFSAGSVSAFGSITARRVR